jgi:hypothetical protein
MASGDGSVGSTASKEGKQLGCRYAWCAGALPLDDRLGNWYVVTPRGKQLSVVGRLSLAFLHEHVELLESS